MPNGGVYAAGAQCRTAVLPVGTPLAPFGGALPEPFAPGESEPPQALSKPNRMKQLKRYLSDPAMLSLKKGS
jgi:hypothetical protein